MIVATANSIKWGHPSLDPNCDAFSDIDEDESISNSKSRTILIVTYGLLNILFFDSPLELHECLRGYCVAITSVGGCVARGRSQEQENLWKPDTVNSS